MNTTDDNFPAIDDEALDLLVDGELGEPARRDLLTRLEDEPSGWRRCAMAFLEAQCWRQQCREVAQQSVPQPSTPGTSARQSFPFGGGGTVLAMAASFLIALGLGLMVRDVWQPGSTKGPKPVEIATSTAGPGEKSALAAKQPKAVPASNAQRPDVPSGPWQVVTLDTSGRPGEVGGEISVPAIERKYLDEAWLRSLPTALPPDVRQALQRTGHRVRQQRQLVPLRMKDGRRLVLPVDIFDVNYLGNPAYQ
jgi:hypothetical protein